MPTTRAQTIRARWTPSADTMSETRGAAMDPSSDSEEARTYDGVVETRRRTGARLGYRGYGGVRRCRYGKADTEAEQ